jgi:hypothetical protein
VVANPVARASAASQTVFIRLQLHFSGDSRC